MTQDAKRILELAKEQEVRFVELWFTDILGNLKSMVTTVDQLKKITTAGMWFDGSSVTGYAEAEESDILAIPDYDTFQVLPWKHQGEASARMICDIFDPNGEPYAGDPRHALKRVLSRAEKMGFTYNVGPEPEFFYFAESTTPKLLDDKGYFESTTGSSSIQVLRQTVQALESMGIAVEAIHHEVAPSQHEIDLVYTNALTMADIVMTYRTVAKEIAQQNGIYATFMPKPLFGVNGSGMHTHQSLAKGGKNAFYDAKDQWNLSEVAKQFIAGQLKNAREICSVLDQWVNSYKRLVPGYEAPVYISWAQRNRTALIRVPCYRPGQEEATRAELRCPDPACNPYLAFAVMLAAGLEGIEKKYQIPDPVEPNIYHMPPNEREKRGLEELPVNLFEAIKETEASDLVREALGEHIFTRFIHSKRDEWEQDRIQIASHEIAKYLPVL